MSQEEYAQAKQILNSNDSIPTFKKTFKVDQSRKENPFESFVNNGISALPEIAEVWNAIKGVRDEIPDVAPDLKDILVCQLELKLANVCTVSLSPNLEKLAIGRESSDIVLLDFDLADNLQYYSSRVYRHWRRVPVRSVTSSVDFKFLNCNAISGNQGKSI